MKKMTIYSVFVAVLLLPVAAVAEPASQLRVRLDDLDLTTPRGMEAAQLRIDRAIKEVCRSDVEHLSPRARRGSRECREESRVAALAKLDDRRQRQWAAR